MNYIESLTEWRINKIKWVDSLVGTEAGREELELYLKDCQEDIKGFNMKRKKGAEKSARFLDGDRNVWLFAYIQNVLGNLDSNS